MFARWQKRTGLKGGVHWNAALVEAIRVDGNPRQRYVGCLCGIGQQALDGPYRVAVRCGFWDHVMDRLHALGVAPEAHAPIVATLARKVPFPTCEEYIRDHRRAHELLGPEFHRWPAHPLYDLSDLIREVEARLRAPRLPSGWPRTLEAHHHSEAPPDPTHALSFWD